MHDFDFETWSAKFLEVLLLGPLVPDARYPSFQRGKLLGAVECS